MTGPARPRAALAVAMVSVSCLAAGASLAATSAGADTADADACDARLARTLAEMEARPLLKEELATGLMWLRLDAQTALAAGDAAACLEGVAVVEQILGLQPPDR